MPFINGCGGFKINSMQEKTIEPLLEPQTIKPDNEYDALNKLNVKAVKSVSKTVSANGLVLPGAGYICLSSVTVKGISNTFKCIQKNVDVTSAEDSETPVGANSYVYTFTFRGGLSKNLFANGNYTFPNIILIMKTPDIINSSSNTGGSDGTSILCLEKGNDNKYSGICCHDDDYNLIVADYNPASCLTIKTDGTDDSYYDFTVACDFTIDYYPYKIRPYIGILSKMLYDVTFIWN